MPLSEVVEDKRNTSKGIMCAHKVPALGTVENISTAQAFVEGLYAAEGYAKNHRCLEISNKNEEVIEVLCGCLDLLGVPYRMRFRKDGVILVYLKGCPLTEKLFKLGRNSFEIRFAEEALSLPVDKIDLATTAFGIGDAYYPKPGGKWYEKAHKIYNTSSDVLAEQLGFMHLIMGEPLSFYLQKNHMGAGRRPIWRLTHYKSTAGKGRAHRERLPGIENGCIKKVVDDGEAEVCDISVAGTRNFVTPDGVVLSNCDDHGTLLNAMFASIGMQTGYETIRSDPANPDEFSHVYSIVKTPVGWRAADPTVAISTFGWRPTAGVFGRKIWV
jgi:hypothetical protein